MTSRLYPFEEVEIPSRTVGPSAVVDRAEMIAFAEAWDPMPFHLDDAAGMAAFGGATAPGVYVMAFKQRLLHRLDARPDVIASGGFDEVRFLQPVRPGDRLTLALDWLEKRLSKSRPDRGIVKVRSTLVNQRGETAFTKIDIVLVRVRAAASTG